MKRSSLSLAVSLSMLSLFAPLARADVAGALCEGDRGLHVDVITSLYKHACLGHVERAGGRWVRTIALPEPMSGDVRGSRDLQTVIYVANYLSLRAEEALAQDPVVVRVYHRGELKKEHRLSAIATAADLRESISHVRFAREVGSIDSKHELTIVTNTGARVVFDGLSGERRVAR